ncbi:CRAL/TRIO domain-containing protein [Rhizoclosmatium globosum]|uniref:CRAL/TRIO domain-containing protein n=1 Tax=Rhizoclosmatium globosum TaxID=329046 RepID=A0A1Y2BN03_9FUNG|nr:CRAL/TRIO domain-containing protein [Rhizoclosmatium globosum]|eukprot:ORY36138.1 CRAL/TRIO domain-containing protein [Rhizoclosmatium globosum]
MAEIKRDSVSGGGHGDISAPAAAPNTGGQSVRASVTSLTSFTNVSNSWLNLAELALSETKLSELRDIEQKFLSTARELYKSEKVDVLNDHELLKFLKCNKHHAGKALGAVSEHLAWRESFKTHDILHEDFNDQDQTGAAQFVGRTRTGVPILILNNSRHKTPKDAAGRDRVVRYAVHLVERARSEGILTDKLLVILDRFNTTNGQMDTYTFKTLIPIFQKNYPDTLQRFILFPNSTYFWMAWKLLKGSIDPVTLKKIEIRDNPETLIGIIDRDQLFERYGGLVKDMYDEIPITHDPETHPSPTSAAGDSDYPHSHHNHHEASSPDELIPTPTVDGSMPSSPHPTPTKTAAEQHAVSETTLDAPPAGSLGPVSQQQQPQINTDLNQPTPTSATSITSAPSPASTSGNSEPPKKSWWKFGSSSTTSPQKSAENTPQHSPDKASPGGSVTSPASSTVSSAPKSAGLAIPPLVPLTVEVLFDAESGMLATAESVGDNREKELGKKEVKDGKVKIQEPTESNFVI